MATALPSPIAPAAFSGTVNVANSLAASGVNTSTGFLTGSGGVGPIKGRAPDSFLWLNPFAWFVMAYQKVLVLGQWPTAGDWLALAGYAVAGLAVAAVLLDRRDA